MRQFCLGLLLVDSTPAPHGGHRGMQWLRCRLEMLFRFYDLNADGKLDRDEFVHFVRHMLRLAGQPHDLDTAKATAKQIAKALPVARREALSGEDFIAVVSSGELHKYQLHTSGLLQLPPFRQPAVAPAHKRPAKPALRQPRARIRERGQGVTISSAANVIPIPLEGNGRQVPLKMQPAHPHTRARTRSQTRQKEEEKLAED